MGRGPQRWNEKTIEHRLYVEKRGSGTFENYKPWLDVQDVSSLGRERRVYGHKSNRIHHLLSDVEWNLFLLLEWRDDIIDIREQFPLDRERTLRIADAANIKHPRYPGTQVLTVMTADFVVTRMSKDGNQYLEAYNTKCASEMTNPNSTAKLEIQRRYFEELGISHTLVLDSELKLPRYANVIRNIEWIRSTKPTQHEALPFPDFFESYARRFVRSIMVAPIKNQPLFAFCKDYDSLHGLEPGTSLRIAGVAMYQRWLVPDLMRTDIPKHLIGELECRINSAATLGRKVA